MDTTVGHNVMPLQALSAQSPPAETVPDELLVRQLRDGDPSAGEVLVKRYAPALLRYLQRLARSEHLAEELHQQTWLAVLDNLARFDEKSAGGFKAWLFRIATNKANDVWRSRGRERAMKDGLRYVSEEVHPDASFRIETSEEDRKLALAIDQLPAAQRQVLMLRYYSELKFVEIAQILGCPLNTALGRMHKAILKLRELME